MTDEFDTYESRVFWIYKGIGFVMCALSVGVVAAGIYFFMSWITSH